MKNVQTTLKDNGKTLVIEVDLTQSQGPSSSGKNEIIATTAGNVNIPVPGKGDVTLGLNLYTKR
ncbi:MAG: hypothetical protein M3Z04_16255 [Chloroflexota bacterium]|nr:hypothetical protein [Chloroflexota bacterium]